MSLIAYIAAIVCFILAMFGVGDFSSPKLIAAGLIAFVLGHVLGGLSLRGE